MNSVKKENVHEAAERQLHEDRDREQSLVTDARLRSEDQDRGFVRRALDRGTLAKEIEENLLRTSDFRRLNPDRDLLAYVRGLIDEEETASAYGLSELGPLTPIGDSPRSASDEFAQAANGRAASSESIARQYIDENFEPSEWLAVVIRNRESNETIQRIATADKIRSHDFQSWLRYKNANGSDIYLSLNTFKEQARGRTKADIKQIRHLYLDLDEEGQRKLAAIQNDTSVPPPNYVLNTSPQKFQIIWKVSQIDREDAESLLRSLAQRFGGDPAATDSTRVFRLPGFNNKKYEENFSVTIRKLAPTESVYHASDFKLEGPVPDRSWITAQSLSSHNSQVDRGKSQSERDWSYALRHLKQGEEPEQVILRITAYRSVDRYDPNDPQKLVSPSKPSPRYYAEHTVRRAMASLGLTDAAGRQPEPQTGSSSPEVEPSR
jgi:RepB DNA-primase N-terminal domain